MVSFKPLGNPQARCFQSLITLDSNNVNVLVDVGWDELLSPENLSSLIELIPSIDVILLTHASISHSGAFSFLRAKYPQFRSIPVYATLPVIRLGVLMTLDLYLSTGLCGPFDNPDAVDSREIEQIWSEVQSVRYSQPVQIHSSPKLEGTVITAFNAGHSLGGSLWKVYDGVDSIVVALDWNHARDAHLSGAFLETKTGTVVSDLQKPSLLITSTDVGAGIPLTKARQQFLDNVNTALTKGGMVLLPTSTGTRALELLLILEKYIAANYNGVPLIYCSHYGKQSLTQAASMLEWMVPSIMSDWQVQNESPFDTGRVHHVHDLRTISQKWPSGPRVVLASGECLESGFSKETFLNFVAKDPTSTVIITELCPAGTLAAKILGFTNNNQLTQLSNRIGSLDVDVREPLTGKALASYRQRQEAEREKILQAEALEKRNQELIDTTATVEDDISESDSDYENFDPETIGTGIFLYGDKVYDYHCPEDTDEDEDGKPITFPYAFKRIRFDEYGEYLPHGMFSDKSSAAKKKQRLKQQAAAANSGEDQEISEVNEEFKEDKDSKETKSEKLEARPMKITKTKRKNINLVCWAVYADMNGLTNLRSMQMILTQTQPSRIIALPGSAEVCEGLSKLSKNFMVADKEVTFERTNFSVDVRIDPSVKLRWRSIHGGYSVARVGGTLEFDPNDRAKRSGVVMVASKEHHDTNDAEKKVAVGDLRLTALRKVLNEKGIKAEFRGQGILACGENVIVRKDENDSFTLFGGVDPEYYIVRDAIRQFIAIV